MLDLQILGFLDDGPLHGYEIRRRILELSGPGTRLSDGTLYPALARLERQGLLTRSAAAGTRGRTRQVLTLTEAGRERLHALLREADGPDVASMPRFMTVLAFLSHLPDPGQREAVLRRRLAAMETAPAFFVDDGVPRRLAQEDDPYRRGMILTAHAARTAELAWLRDQLGQHAREGRQSPDEPAGQDHQDRPTGRQRQDGQDRPEHLRGHDSPLPQPPARLLAPVASP